MEDMCHAFWRGESTKILDFIRSEIETMAIPLGARDMRRRGPALHVFCAYAPDTAGKKGLIRRDATKPRALELLDSPLSKARTVPLVGKVTAGQPILAIENIEDQLIIPNDLASMDTELFALRVQGESMIEAGILDGDIVIVHSQERAENGDIVVALIGDEATLKRIYYENGHVRLQPENHTMAPIIVPRAEVRGKVVALVRRF